MAGLSAVLGCALYIASVTGSQAQTQTVAFGPVRSTVTNVGLTVIIPVPANITGLVALRLTVAGNLADAQQAVYAYLKQSSDSILISPIGLISAAENCAKLTIDGDISEDFVNDRADSNQLELYFDNAGLGDTIDAVCGTNALPFSDPFKDFNDIGSPSSFAVEGTITFNVQETSSSTTDVAVRQQLTVAATRGALITEHGPDVHGRIARLKGNRAAQDNETDDGTASNQAMSFLGGQNLRHRSSGRQAVGRGDQDKYGPGNSLGRVSLKDDNLNYKSGSRQLGPVTVWSEGTIVGVNDVGGDGHRFRIAHSGAEMLLGEHTIIGLGVQVDNLTYTDAPTGDKFDGTGWMVGPYIHSRVRDNLFVDVRLAFGKVNSDVTRAVGEDDEYESDRALAQVKVVGDFTYGKFLFAPTAEFSFYREGSKSYISNVHGAIPETTVELFNGVFGGRVSRTFNITDGTISPYVEASAVYYNLLTGDGGVLTYSYADAIEGWSAKVGTGLRAAVGDNTMITLGSEYTDGKSGAWALGGFANVAITF